MMSKMKILQYKKLIFPFTKDVKSLFEKPLHKKCKSSWFKENQNKNDSEMVDENLEKFYV